MARHSVSRQVHERLRRKIILGEYAQGEVLHETRVADDLEVSRVPVREAMPLLRQQGFVESESPRRTVVTSWTVRHIDDLFDARLGVEVAAAGAAARRLGKQGDPDALAALGAAMAQSNEHLALNHPVEVALANAAVHDAFVAASGNPLLVELMRVLTGRMAWLFYLTSGRDIRHQNDEHHTLLAAIGNGDVRLAESLMSFHIESGRRPTLEVLGWS